MKQSKRVENPNIMTIVMMQMRAEAEDQAHGRREKVEDQREMEKDRKQLAEVMVGIALGYFASRGGGRRKKI